jgi:hypothetical protein
MTHVRVSHVLVSHVLVPGTVTAVCRACDVTQRCRSWSHIGIVQRGHVPVPGTVTEA